MKLKLKAEYVEKIKRDPIVHGMVAKILNLSPNSLAIPLRKGSSKLIQKDVLIVLCKYFGVSEHDLIEEIEESETV
jgi:septum formation topological specificity factor MinE